MELKVRLGDRSLRITRGDFIKLIAGCGVALGLYGFTRWTANSTALLDTELDLKEASYYQELDGKVVQCKLCFRECVIPPKGIGNCTNRRNMEGRLYNVVYEKPCAVHVDPIEKEPQFHMLPGSRIFCIGTSGCNFRCNFCHNWSISTKPLEETAYFDLPCIEIVNQALGYKANISFTYNEPTVAYEYMYDTFKLASEKGIRNIFHTNGGMNPEALSELLRYVDAVTVDLKAFSAEFYRSTSTSDLSPVLETLKVVKEKGAWLEIVNLMIPTLNDDLALVREMCLWILENLGHEIPLHFNRFSPAYKLKNLPPTPVETLEEARKIAMDLGLSYVYVGNVPGHPANSTYCPECQEVVIGRTHFTVHENRLKEGACRFCGHEIPGIWS